MNYVFILVALLGQFPNFFGFPIEAEVPKDNKPKATMFIGLDDDEFSKHLEMELTKDWSKEQARPRRPDQSQEQWNTECSAFYNLKYKMIGLNRTIRDRVDIRFVRDRSELPSECPAFHIGKNSKWEKFPKEGFREYTFPLMTVLYEIDLWYLPEWREALEERRQKADREVTVMNNGVDRINESILQEIYGPRCGIYPIKQVTAIYWFDGKLWKKLASPAQGHIFIPDNEVASIQAQNKNAKLHKVECYISGYEIRTDVYSEKMIQVPIDGLNCRLMPETFPSVELLPNPPWEPKYSFVPF